MYGIVKRAACYVRIILMKKHLNHAHAWTQAGNNDWVHDRRGNNVMENRKASSLGKQAAYYNTGNQYTACYITQSLKTGGDIKTGTGIDNYTFYV